MKNIENTTLLFPFLILFIYFTHYILTSPYFKIEQHLKKIFFSFLTILLFTIITPVGHRLTELGLRALKRGGKYNTTLYLDIKKTESLPDQIFIDKNKGISKKVMIILDSSDFIYFMPEDDKNYVFEMKSDLIISNAIKRK